MLFMHENLTAAPDRQQDVVDRVQTIHSYMVKNPGFAGARVARYLGNYTDYLCLRWWRSAEDLAAHGRNPEVPNWGANRPEGIYLRNPKTTRWESARKSGEPNGAFFVRTIYTPGETSSDALLDSVANHIEKFTGEGGLTWGETFRSLDEAELAGAVLCLAGFQDRESFDSYLRNPEATRMFTSGGGFEIFHTGCYEVVAQAPPGKLPA